MIYFMALPMTFSGAMGAYFFKKTAVKVSGIMSLFTCADFYLGGLFYIVGSVINITLLRYVQYSILYPMTAFTYIWTAILSWRLLGETITKRAFGGIVMICIGLIFLIG